MVHLRLAQNIGLNLEAKVEAKILALSQMRP